MCLYLYAYPTLKKITCTSRRPCTGGWGMGRNKTITREVRYLDETPESPSLPQTKQGRPPWGECYRRRNLFDPELHFQSILCIENSAVRTFLSDLFGQ